MSEEFLMILALAILVVAGVGFLAGVFWGIPTAKRDRDSVDSEERGMVVFANYQVLVARLSTFCLLCFIFTAGLILAFDVDAVPRVLGARLLVFAAVGAIAALVVAGPVARKRANRGEVARLRKEEEARAERARLQETVDETNEGLKAMLGMAAGVRERLEEQATEIRERLEEQATRTQNERDQVKDDLGAEQSKIRNALGKEQGTVRERLDESDALDNEERIAARISRVEETQARQELKQDRDLIVSDRNLETTERLEAKLDTAQGDRDQVKDDLGAEQSKVQDALGKEQDTVREKKEKREREQDERRDE